MPLLIEAIREVSAEMMIAAAHAIEDCLNPEMPPANVGEHIAPLMQRLIKMCEMDEDDVHRIAVSCMGRIAKVAPASFLSYAPNVLQHLTRIINTPDANLVDLELVCQALDTVGCIVSSVENPAPMAPLIKELTELVFRSMTRFNDPDVTVAGYHYFASLAESVPAECAAQLPRLLPIVHASCTSTKGLPGHGEDLLAGGGTGDGEDAGSGGLVAVHTSYVQVKETACNLFLALSNFLERAFLPHAAGAFERVLSLRAGSGMGYASLRQTTGFALGGLAASIFTNGSGVAKWKAGLPPPPGLAANVQTALGVAVKAQFELFQDRDRNVVRNGLEAMKIILIAAGPFIFTAAGQAEQLMEGLAVFLQGKAPCFLDASDDDAEGMDAADLLQDELTMNVIEDAFDTMVAAAAALGPSFKSFGAVLLPLIAARSAPSNNVTLRSTSVGCLAEIIEALGATAAEFAPMLVPVLVAATRDKETEVSSNAAYAIGVLGEASGARIAPHVPTLLQALSANCIAVQRDSASAIDNACGAVARLILASPANIPLAAVAPRLFASLPLKVDFAENHVVYRCVDALAKHNFAVVAPAFPHILAAFCAAAGAEEPQVGPETCTLMAGLCKWLSGQPQSAAAFAAAVKALNVAQKAVMQRACPGI